MDIKFKIIVAGCGGMAREWVRYALSRDDAKIVGLMDINLDNARGLKEEFGLDLEVYDDLETSIKETGANLVFDITIPKAHHDTAITALGLGCHVMGEKPMAETMEEAKEMVDFSLKSGKSFAVMQNRRYLKNIRALRELIDKGTIGKPGFVNADFFLGPHFGGFREIMESPLILDMAIHTFDQARFITGADAKSVYCHEFNPAGSWYDGDASAICIFEMTDGSVFCYRGSWCAEGAPTSWESTWRIIGSKGTALWDGNEAPYADIVDEDGEKGFFNQYKSVDAPFTWQGREGHEGCLDEMFEAILEDRRAETHSTDNINSMAMVFAAIESARKGKKIIL